MLRPRFDSLALRYGCHDDAWVFPERDRPVVIAGPNGSGKSTLVEGLVRTLFGFDRRRSLDASDMEARRPWRVEGMGGRVVLALEDERIEVRRDFRTGHVRVFDRVAGIERFAGDGNPAARNQEALHYHGLLTELLGLRDLPAYARTLFVRQGELPENALGERLLQVAAGGHARVEAARRRLAEEHRSVTRRPLHPAARPAINARQLEKIEEEIEELEDRLSQARQATDLRGPLARERDEASDRLEHLDRQIEQLEEAQAVLGRTVAAELGARRRRAELRRIEAATATVRREADRLAAAEHARDAAMADGRYPADFPERLARAEVRWRDLRAEDRWPRPWLGATALALLLAGGAALALGRPIVAAVAGGVGLLLGAAWVALMVVATGRRAMARREAAEALAGVPGADSLGPGNRDTHLGRYREQRDAEARVAAGREQLADAARHARSLLRELDLPPRADDEDRAPPALEGATTDRPSVRRIITRLKEDGARVRETLVRDRIELERIGDASLGLPDDVPPTEEEVSRALRSRRAERAALQQELQRLSRDLLDRGTPAESANALEARMAALVPQREALERKARVFETAHALVADAYDVFRDEDQDRLARRVSVHAQRLSGFRLGPLEAATSLDDARVRVNGRSVDMAAPPLSYGELHALQLAVRLGAADFLAGVGVLPPLIIDEPFAHLDGDRAASVWSTLRAVAADRQVIVTTQDERLLAALDVQPDIRLNG
jgi:DNA repair exonuclease SbcCD ATPase subunit